MMDKPLCAVHDWGEWRESVSGRDRFYYRLCQTCDAVDVCPPWRYELGVALEALGNAVKKALHLDAVVAGIERGGEWLCGARGSNTTASEGECSHNWRQWLAGRDGTLLVFHRQCQRCKRLERAVVEDVWPPRFDWKPDGLYMMMERWKRDHKLKGK
jgi:hypothetical protein